MRLLVPITIGHLVKWFQEYQVGPVTGIKNPLVGNGGNDVYLYIVFFALSIVFRTFVYSVVTEYGEILGHNIRVQVKFIVQ